MRRRWLAGVAALLAAMAATAQPEDAVEAPSIAPRIVLPAAGHVDWAPRGDWLAFDRTDADGYSRLYVARPDGRDERCLTCLPLEFRKHHTGNATWHPSGRYLVFEVVRPFRRAGANEALTLVPGRNLGSELWAMTFDGRTFWQLTRVGERGGRTHSPRFSHEGDHLVWAERVAAGGGDWGTWDLRVAEISERREVPVLRKTRTYRIGKEFSFHEPCGFTGDDRGVVVASDANPGRPEEGLALFVVRLDRDEVTRLTGSESRWNRFARLAPGGRALAWASDRELPAARSGPPPALDLWTMDPRGGSPLRLTSFNDVFSANYSGAVTVRSVAWAPAGDRLLAVVAPRGETRDGTVYRVELSGES